MLGLALLGLALIPVGGWFFLALTGFVAYFFRDPERSIPTDPGLLLSPADGKVVAVSPLQKDPVQPSGTLVSIFLSVFDVHINRTPIAGTVVDVRYQPGKFLPAFRAAASDLNEQNVVTLQAAGSRVITKQIAGILPAGLYVMSRWGTNSTRGNASASSVLDRASISSYHRSLLCVLV